jgi:pimeloyl-ACP methyl ester carboxylesterase
MSWHYTQTGGGRPLVLLHGIGMSHAVWTPVTPYLQPTRRVIAFDIAGFGATPPLPRETPPTIANLVGALEQSLRAIGIDEPVDMAGNSLGGGMALEAARRGIARRVVAISPIGLWRDGPPRHVRYIFGSLRWMAARFPKTLAATMRPAWLREMALALPMSTGSRRMPPDDAIAAVDDLRRSTAFEETFERTRDAFDGRDITVPVTVAFGDRDWVLTKSARHRDGLPAHARWVTMKGWGHVPMWVDPIGVARLITASLCPCPSWPQSRSSCRRRRRNRSARRSSRRVRV